ncbi:uncharacterized protein PV07_10267 [Cladophialophora immunda]|uniref:Alpha-1,3-mannosyltransferase CMT1 n=1 Tax=Cladophialophora immunda TaxID=569365 RepID=A0A0D2BZQ3_9EURO|nr:uncharacterized protein PV07_10267 [Cladophialophora immunda]KIW24558.1 hypothetical protein PV07_10267 [Cladophialophora immunda]OQV08568.1 hypothetical protein CLAIMM_12821 [Cladophialophora immunda]
MLLVGPGRVAFHYMQGMPYPCLNNGAETITGRNLCHGLNLRALSIRCTRLKISLPTLNSQSSGLTMASSLWPMRSSERIYMALLLLCLFYIFLSSPILKHAESIVKPAWKAPTISDISESSDLGIEETVTLEGESSHDFGDDIDEHTTAAVTVDPGEEKVSLPSVPTAADLDESRMGAVGPYIAAIMDPRDTHFDRLQCPRPLKDRYKMLRQRESLPYDIHQPQKRFFFALNLYQCAYVLPRLLGSVVEAMRFLGPEDCVLSIVGGRSDDGTTEILVALKDEVEGLNATYYFGTSDIDPLKSGNDRVTELAKLRNLALAPLIAQHEEYARDTSVIFLNDVSICTDDILELIYQKQHQRADMVCAMDWNNNGDTFYDSWIGRSMNGDLFVEVPQSGSFEFSHNLFWNDRKARSHIDDKLPLQVFACWNGAVVFQAEPLLSHSIRFRAAYKGECYSGEPTLFCKDLWTLGHGRIAVIPSVNVGYNDDQSRGVKAKHGYASGNVQQTEHDMGLSTEIDWKKSPPQLVKCQPDWTHSSWAPWDEAAGDHVPFDWSRSGYFNAKKPFDKDLEFEKDGKDGAVGIGRWKRWL